MTKTLSVPAIEHGTVIDHINSEQTLRILRVLDVLRQKKKITVGFNLASKRMQVKDLIKIENHLLTENEANELTVLAPEATISIIQDFEVSKKFAASLPNSVERIFVCPNESCISNQESVETKFKTQQLAKKIKLICHFCEKSFERDDVKLVNT